MKSWIRKMGIRITGFRFILATGFALIVILSMTFVGVALNQKFMQITKEKISDNSLAIMEQAERNLDIYIKGMIDLSNVFIKDINRFKILNVDQIDQDVSALMRMRSDLLSMALFTTKGRLLYDSAHFQLKKTAQVKEQAWFNAALKEEGEIYISPPHVQNLFNGRHPWVITLARKVNFRTYEGSHSGILMLDMNFSVIEDLLTDVHLGKNGYVFLVDSKDNLVYHHQQQLIYTGIKKETWTNEEPSDSRTLLQVDNRGKERLLTMIPASHVDWRLIGVYYLSDLSAAQRDLSRFLLLTLVIGMIAFTAVSIYITDRITKPIATLEKSMEAVEKGNFDIQIDVKGEYEVVALSKRFNLMTSQIKTLMAQVVEEQESKRKSELSALQAQINPHFLYNTLDSVIWMAENEKHKEVVKMVTALAKLFRISLSKGRTIISVEEEVTHAKNYLTIQKMRYKDQFEYQFEVEDSVRKLKTLKLILQPIIENAIYHGVRQMIDPGQIIISVKQKNGTIEFKVTDNGLGMEPEACQKILKENLQNQRKTVGVGGVGVRNVNDRIKLMYGSDYGVDIKSELENGTQVTLTIPIWEDPAL